MRHARVAIVVLLIGVIALTFTCVLLATGAPCISAPALPIDTPNQLVRLDTIEPGERFELLITPADINAYLAGYLHTHEHAILSTVVVAFGENHITIDLCAQGILFRPVPSHIAFAVEQGEQAPEVTCSIWSIGRIKIPRPIRQLLSRRLNAELARADAGWRIERWALKDGSLCVDVVRRH